MPSQRVRTADPAASMRPRRARLGCHNRSSKPAKPARASMRPRRARLGCLGSELTLRQHLIGFNEAEARAPRMPTVAMILAASEPCFNEAEARAPRMLDPRGRMVTAPGFNEAEARAPRMQPPYKPLDTKAILLRFRPVAHGDGRNLPNSTRHRIDHVKELHDFNNLPRFERVRGFARHIAARKRPADTKHA